MDEIKDLITGINLNQSTLMLRLFYSSLLILVGWILKFFMERIIDAKSVELETVYKTRKGIRYFITILVIIGLGRIWVSGFESFVTIFGLLGYSAVF